MGSMMKLPPDMPHDFSDPRYVSDAYVVEQMRREPSVFRPAVLLVATFFTFIRRFVVGVVDGLLLFFSGRN